VTDGKCPKPDPDYPNDYTKKCGRPVFPFEDVLAEKSQHISFDALEIDTVNNTVRITDKDARIDVGALGKGYATELVAQHLESKGVTSYALNIGGNIRIIGTKRDGSGWPTGIKNPRYFDPDHPKCLYSWMHKDLDKNSYCDNCNETKYIKKITISNISCVTSGNYERNFKVDGIKYHHIIDKDTLMPAQYFSSVTILTKNSGLADALSTALFSMSYEEGLALVEKIGNVEVLWVRPDGTTEMTKGFEALLME
jgi:thiamine biosynthesis lipoprotein